MKIAERANVEHLHAFRLGVHLRQIAEQHGTEAEALVRCRFATLAHLTQRLMGRLHVIGARGVGKGGQPMQRSHTASFAKGFVPPAECGEQVVVGRDYGVGCGGQLVEVEVVMLRVAEVEHTVGRPSGDDAEGIHSASLTQCKVGIEAVGGIVRRSQRLDA